MNIPFVAEETFQILRSYDYEVVFYNEDGAQVWEPVEARRFFDKSKNILIALVESNEDTQLRLYVGSGIDMDDIANFRMALRALCSKYNILFHVREFGRAIEPKDFATRASVTENTGSTMQLLEGLYGTSRSSYLKLENARVIVRHKKRVDENIPGARGRNIESIFVENSSGERMLFPTRSFVSARALAHHLDVGGTWADKVGQQIIRMARDYADLSNVQRVVANRMDDTCDDGLDLRLRLRECICQYRKTFAEMCRKNTYERAARRLSDTAAVLTEEASDGAKMYVERALAGITARLSTPLKETLARALEAEERVNSQSLRLFEQDVSREAWRGFVEGVLPLFGPVESLTEGNDVATISENLIRIAERTCDESLSNLFAHVAGSMVRTNDSRKLSDMKALGVTAYRRAINETKNPEEVRFNDLGKSEAIDEFAEWVATHDVDTIISEMGYDMSSEDIILPKSAQDDLIDDVSPATVKDPHTGDDIIPDEEYVERLKALAGVAPNQ